MRIFLKEYVNMNIVLKRKWKKFSKILFMKLIKLRKIREKLEVKE